MTAKALRDAAILVVVVIVALYIYHKLLPRWIK